MTGDKFNLVALAEVMAWIADGWWALIIVAVSSMALGVLVALASISTVRALRFCPPGVQARRPEELSPSPRANN